MEANNNAKMREALVEIDELTNLLDIPEDKKNLLFAPSHSFVAVKIRKIIKRALEEPARNCDVPHKDEHELWLRWQAYCAEIYPSMVSFSTWLLAPAQEEGAK